jgi:hypothetical protein
VARGGGRGSLRSRGLKFGCHRDLLGNEAEEN